MLLKPLNDMANTGRPSFRAQRGGGHHIFDLPADALTLKGNSCKLLSYPLPNELHPVER